MVFIGDIHRGYVHRGCVAPLFVITHDSWDSSPLEAPESWMAIAQSWRYSNSWMVYFMDNLAINGWWLGVPLWRNGKPPKIWSKSNLTMAQMINFGKTHHSRGLSQCASHHQTFFGSFNSLSPAGGPSINPRDDLLSTGPGYQGIEPSPSGKMMKNDTSPEMGWLDQPCWFFIHGGFLT